MRLIQLTKIGFLVLGDIAVLYCALFLGLFLRYGEISGKVATEQHLIPFSMLFLIWLLVFYIAGLYDVRRLRNNLDFFRVLTFTLGINAVLGVAFFYLFPGLGIMPKTNLFIVIITFGILEFFWRRTFNQHTLSLTPPVRVILASKSNNADKLVSFLSENPQLGYQVVLRINEEDLPTNVSDFEKIIRENEIGLLVIPHHSDSNAKKSSISLALFEHGLLVKEFVEFYEIVFRQIPLENIGEEWIWEHVNKKTGGYSNAKRLVEVVLALISTIIFVPVGIVIALLIKLTSRGPIIYSQVRVGLNGKNFTLYKFRTMYEDAEKHGPQWAEANDRRSTPLGQVLRKTHLDEIAQLWNILKGDLSFVGPRPERPEFVSKLTKEIPYYELRTVAKPGLTGWAQLNHRADLTSADVREKLAYDLYYLKNKSLVLDLAIILKTLKVFFSNPK